RIDVRVRCLQRGIDDDSATWGTPQASTDGQFTPRGGPSRNQDDIGGDGVLLPEAQPPWPAAFFHMTCLVGEQDLEPQFANFCQQHGGACGIELAWHEMLRHFNNYRLESQLIHGACCFQPQQSTTNHGGTVDGLTPCQNRL